MGWMRIQSCFNSESAEKGSNASVAMRQAMRQFARALTLCLAASGVLIAAPATFGQSNVTQIDKRVQQTCVEKGQRFVCDVSSKQGNDLIAAELTNSAKRQAAQPVATALIDPKTDETIANILLATCYIGMPISLILALWLHDKYNSSRTMKLKEQIELLERIWRQGSQTH